MFQTLINATHLRSRIERCNGWIPAAWQRSWGPSGSKRQTSRGRFLCIWKKATCLSQLSHQSTESSAPPQLVPRSLDFLFLCHLRPEYATVRKHSSSVKLHPPRKAAKWSPVPLNFGFAEKIFREMSQGKPGHLGVRCHLRVLWNED